MTTAEEIRFAAVELRATFGFDDDEHCNNTGLYLEPYRMATIGGQWEGDQSVMFPPEVARHAMEAALVVLERYADTLDVFTSGGEE